MSVPYNDFPPLRLDPFAADGNDSDRREFAHKMWRSQDAALSSFARQVEENVRMLFGDQWIVWSPAVGRFFDLNDFLTDEEKVWRQKPVINRLIFWYMLTHSRMTENQPIFTFRPGPDRIDSQLAEAWDTIHKVLWDETGMLENQATLMAWLIPGGQAFLKSRVDTTKGPIQVFRGDASVPRINEFGEPSEMVQVEGAPFGEDGNPLVEFDAEGEAIETGKPFSINEGGLEVDVLGPLECRGQWNAKPWHKKRWHMQRTFLTPEEVWDTYGVDVDADTTGVEADQAGELQRLMFGSGWYGSMATELGVLWGGGTADDARGKLVRVDDLWMAPAGFEGMEREVDPDTGEVITPGGRYMVVTKDRVLRDGVRPADFMYTSPIRKYHFLALPGRPAGSTPQEALNPLQRQYNRSYGQVSEHVNLLTAPITVVDAMTGLEEGDISNQPGQIIIANIQPNVPPIFYATPPPLGRDVYEYISLLRQEMQDLGNIEGAEGRVPTPEASGQLVKELRFNSDRFIGPSLKAAVIEHGRLSEDFRAWLQVLWNDGKILTWTGEDHVATTVTILPEMWTGKFNVIPDMESMLPEGRGERQREVREMYAGGIFGPPGTPEAVRKFLELSRFPHLRQAAMPAGIHRVTATQELGQLAMGTPDTEMAVFPWYDHLVHIEVLEEYMSGPEYLRLDQAIQEQFVVHRERHFAAMIQIVAEQFAKQAAAEMGLGGNQVVTENGGPPDSRDNPPSPELSAVGGSRMQGV